MKELDETQVPEGRGCGEQPLLPSGEGASFVVALWVEPQEVDGDPEWRWRVRHVQTEEEVYFRCLADVLEFAASRSGFSPPR